MIEFTVATEIARSPAEVFALDDRPDEARDVADEHALQAPPEDDQPIGLGTRVREVHRAPGGKQLASLVEVSEYEPDRVFALRMLEGALPIHAQITFEPNNGGTQVQFTAARETDRRDATRPTPTTPHPQAPIHRLLRHAQTSAREPPLQRPDAGHSTHDQHARKSRWRSGVHKRSEPLTL